MMTGNVNPGEIKLTKIPQSAYITYIIVNSRHSLEGGVWPRIRIVMSGSDYRKGDVMDIQLQELLDKIKKEGVESARSEAARILAEAEAQKKAIIEAAERDAGEIVRKAQAEARQAEESSTAALAQVSRDSLLAFRAGLEGILAAITRKEVSEAFGPDVMAEAIAVAVKGLAAGGAEDLSVLLPPALLSKVESKAASLLAAELRKGLVIKAGPGLSSGFRIVEKGGARLL